jgi:hypothetical protein
MDYGCKDGRFPVDPDGYIEALLIAYGILKTQLHMA